ncbi:MAG: hypothetical protein R3F59_15445 [Myxococcota bacterium]
MRSDLGHVQHLPDGHACGCQPMVGLGDRERAQGRAERLVEGLAIGDPPGVGAPARAIVEAERRAQALPEPVVAAGDRQPAVRAAVHVVGHEAAVGVAARALHLARHRVARRVVDEAAGLGLHHVHLDALALAGALAVEQAVQHRLTVSSPGDEVGDGAAGAHRRRIGSTGGAANDIAPPIACSTRS